MAELPENYEDKVRNLSVVRRVMHEEIAAVLEPAFNRRIGQMPYDQLEDKRRLCSWANAELRQLGLTIKCPQTGHAGILVTNPHDADDDRGRFRLEVRGDSGKPIRTLYSRDIPPLCLMELSPRSEDTPSAHHRGTPVRRER